MVVIEFSKNDLLNLIGKDIPDEELEELLFLVKLEPEFEEETIKCELHADRPDMFSVEGVAREVKGFLGLEKGIRKYDIKDSKVVVKTENPQARPHIACAIIKGVDLTDELVKSLMQIQEKLHDTIGRERKKVAIGVHDYDKIVPPLRYADVENETFTPLGGTQEMDVDQILTQHPKGIGFAHLVGKTRPMLYDKEGVISFPPIINSERTRVTVGTNNLFIDVTGTDEKAVSEAINIMVCNITERGGTIETVNIDKKRTPDLTPKDFPAEVENIDKILGLGLSENEIADILERMRYGVSKQRGGKMNIAIPPYRTSILHLVDIIEDVAIGYGYNNIEPILPKLPTIGNRSELSKLISKSRDMMMGLGFQEILNFVLTNEESNFSKMLLQGKAAEISNPVSSEYTICRTWLLPSLVRNLTNNMHREYPQRLFEIGNCIILDETKETRIRMVKKLAGIVSHDAANLTEIKSIVENVLSYMGIDYKIQETNHPSFIDSRAGEIVAGEKAIGFFGEIRPEILENWKLEKPVIAFEMEIG
ncbi:MAG: phenylalanine--tRNA ligase subunit beta [Candidatus Aenigmarchaeota archaeon]|nr:phenylalanine--tRNA ligase subunit beta [Candidatus Aenigmarchaeota archaeon]